MAHIGKKSLFTGGLAVLLGLCLTACRGAAPVSLAVSSTAETESTAEETAEPTESAEAPAGQESGTAAEAGTEAETVEEAGTEAETVEEAGSEAETDVEAGSEAETAAEEQPPVAETRKNADAGQTSDSGGRSDPSSPYPKQMSLWDEVPWVDGMRRWIPDTVFTNADFGWPTARSAYDADGDGIEDQRDILLGAKSYVAKAPVYDSSAYYAGGYPTDNRGVCCDVVAFALLAAGYNLRDLVNTAAAMGRSGPYVSWDGNIDFRRTRVLYYFFQYNTDCLSTDPYDYEAWQPGDIILWESVKDGLWPGHIGIVSDRRAADGIPYVIHHTSNNGGLYEDDSLLATNRRIRGHYRINGFQAGPGLLEEPGTVTEPTQETMPETAAETVPETAAEAQTENETTAASGKTAEAPAASEEESESAAVGTEDRENPESAGTKAEESGEDLRETSEVETRG